MDGVLLNDPLNKNNVNKTTVSVYKIGFIFIYYFFGFYKMVRRRFNRMNGTHPMISHGSIG